MQELNNLIHKFENKRLTNPTISTFWMQFLKRKIYKYQICIQQAQHCLDNLNETPDLSMEQIMILSSLISPQNT